MDSRQILPMLLSEECGKLLASLNGAALVEYRWPLGEDDEHLCCGVAQSLPTIVAVAALMLNLEHGGLTLGEFADAVRSEMDRIQAEIASYERSENDD